MLRHLESALAWAAIATVFFLPISEALKNIAYVMSLALYVAILVTARERIGVPAIGWFFLSFLGLTVVSAAASAHPDKAIKGVWEVFRYTSFFLIVGRGVRQEQHVRAVLWASVSGLGVTTVVVLFRYLVLGLHQWPVLSLGGHDAAAEYTFMGLAVMFGIYVHTDVSRWRLIGLITTAVLSIILVGIMHSRMVWGGFILAGAVLGWLRAARVAGTAVVISVLTFLGVGMVNQEVWENIASLKTVEAYTNMGGRVEIWEKAITMWRDAPWLGIGPRTFVLHPDVRLDPQRTKYGFIRDGFGIGQVHNLWLHTLVEMGLVGVFLLGATFAYLGFWLIRWRRSFPPPWPAAVWDGAFGSWLAILVTSLIDTSFGREHAMLLVMLLALLRPGVAGEGRSRPVA